MNRCRPFGCVAALLVCALVPSAVLADTFLDTFSSVSYSNQDGTQNWSSDWNETGDGGNSPSSGDIDIVAGRLHIQDTNNRIDRGADLSSYTTATLSFDYEISSFENGDQVDLEIRSGGSGSWILLDSFTNADPATGTRSYTIDSYIDATTEIRFSTSGMSNFDDFYVDNVLIDATVATGGGGGSCAAVFADGASSSSATGSITIRNNSRITNSPDNILDTTNLNDNSGGVSCDTTTCGASGAAVSPLTYSTFPGGSSVSVGFNATQSIAPGDYSTISLGSQATLQLSPGDYTVSGNVSLGYNASIVVNGSGTVRLLVDGTVTMNSQADINNPGTADQMVLFANGNIDVGSPAFINGFVYSNSTITTSNGAMVTGAVTASNVTLNSASTVNYDSTALAATNFGSLCGGSSLPTPLAEYRLDELLWQGTAGEVLDSSGNGNNGTALQTGAGVQNISDGFICRGATFPDVSSNTSYAIDTGLQVDSDGNNEGAISIWHRAPNDWSATGSTKVLWDASTSSKYFYLYMEADGTLGFGMEDSNDRDFQITTAAPVAISAGQWANIVVNWDVDTTSSAEIWVNGVQQTLTLNQNTLLASSTLSATQSLYIGDNRSNYFPQASNRSAAGDIDEVLVFNSPLSATDIATLYSLQSSGLNLDGSARVCPATPVAEYYFDEALWNGTAGEVADNTGNGLNGAAVNGATTANTNPTPARSGNPGTCRYGDFDGNTQYVSIADNNLLDITDNLTVTAWIYPRAFPGSDLDTILSKDTNYEFHLNTSNQINWWWQSSTGTHQFNTTGTPLSADTWYHVAIVYTDGAQSIYINGVQQGSASYTGTLTTNADPLLVGTDLNFVGSRNFNGAIDEVKVFNSALSATEVMAIYQQTHPCTISAVDHYAISWSGSGLTCEPITVTVTGHDSSHSSIPPAAGTTIALSTSTGQGTWSNPSEGSLVDNGGGSADYTFAGGNSITLNFSTSQPGLVNFDINSGSSPNESAGVEDPSVTFVDSGFRIVDGADAPIPLQTAARDSSQLYLQAVRTDTNTGACVNAFAAGTLANIELAVECSNPSTCIGGTELSVDYIDNGGSNNALLTAQDLGSPTYANLPAMLFATDSKTPIVLNYPDAGQLQLSSRYEVLDDSGGATGEFIASSTQFVVNPVGLCVQAQVVGGSNPACSAPYDQCSTYVAAGANFDLLIAAKAWQSDTDTNLCDNPTTQNFAASNIDLASTLVAPSGGTNGSLATSSGIAINSGPGGGQVLQPETYSEVGVVTFSATASDYFYVGNAISGTSDNVGRFIPDHFAMILGSVSAANSASAAFTFLGQPFSLSYTLEARSVSSARTQNYDGAFAKLDPTSHAEVGSSGGEDILYGAVDAATPQSYNSNLTTSSSGAIWANGLLDVVGLPLIINKPSAAVAPIADVDIGIRVEDSDNVAFLPSGQPMGLDLDSSTTGGNDAVKVGDLDGELLFARLYIPPVYGPEIFAGDVTAIPFEIQYFDGSNYVIYTTDNSTRYGTGSTMATATTSNHTGNVSAADVTAGDINFPALQTVIDGRGRLITINRPGAGKDGTVDITFAVDPWLQYNWNGSGDTDPTTTVTFGSYRGNDRIIYWREVH